MPELKLAQLMAEDNKKHTAVVCINILSNQSKYYPTLGRESQERIVVVDWWVSETERDYA